VWKKVEETFERVGLVLELEVGGRTIGTTAEHPFYVLGKGWTAAGELKPGDRIVGLDPRESVAVTALRLTGRQEKLYNLRVADYHTYFVGDSAWAFALWAHNTTYAEVLSRGQPWKGRFPKTAQPFSILYRVDNTGRITSYQVYNRLGLPMKRVDIVGKPHGGIPTPHVTVFIYDKSPYGLKPRPSPQVRPAYPSEIP
jgi:intein/homing endonuclease